MNKRILSMVIVLLMCLTLLPQTAAAAASTTATYADGIVTVVGSGFASGTSYTVRVVDTANSSIEAMGQSEADEDGSISASITTGVLGTWSNYTVYINKPDGTLAGSFTYSGGNGGGGNGGGGSGGDSGGSGGGNVTPAPTTTIEVNEVGNTTYIYINVDATIDSETGTATAKVNESDFNELINKVKVAEAAGQKAVVVIRVAVPSVTSAVIVEIPRDAFNRLVAETNASVEYDAGIGTISFREKTVEFISGAANSGNIFISITRISSSALTSEVQAKVGDRPVFEFSVKAGNSEISKFNGGNVEVNMPYTLKAGEKRNSVIAYLIDNAGKLKTIRGKFVSATGAVNFRTTHFSMFAVGYNEVNFNDVAEKAWYNEAIGFMSARGIVKGVGGGRFAPESNVTRADFLIMVMNSYGIELDTTIASNFADAGSKYYTQYLATAKRLGLVNGVGKNKYAPEAAISRQDMFVTLYRTLGKLSELSELPTGANSGKSLGSFNDAGKIATYATDAMKLFVEAGAIVGDGKNLTPKATSTRAQTAQVLYNLLSE